MDSETKKLLREIIANQAIIFHRIEDLYQNQIKGTQKMFYDEKRALSDMTERAKKIIGDID